ncbi:MAG UNVERIFIED_CONTAM: DUF1016 N-terminal domain-containing protein [Rickettsiaceae bacterium]|jgi:hypothetical protein
MTALSTELFSSICKVLDQAHLHLQRAVNVTIVQTYWSIGKLIVEHEQKGESRAEYGTRQLQQLAAQLTAAYGKSFIERNLIICRKLIGVWMEYGQMAILYPLWALTKKSSKNRATRCRRHGASAACTRLQADLIPRGLPRGWFM